MTQLNKYFLLLLMASLPTALYPMHSHSHGDHEISEAKKDTFTEEDIHYVIGQGENKAFLVVSINKKHSLAWELRWPGGDPITLGELIRLLDANDPAVEFSVDDKGRGQFSYTRGPITLTSSAPNDSLWQAFRAPDSPYQKGTTTGWSTFPQSIDTTRVFDGDWIGLCSQNSHHIKNTFPATLPNAATPMAHSKHIPCAFCWSLGKLFGRQCASWEASSLALTAFSVALIYCGYKFGHHTKTD